MAMVAVPDATERLSDLKARLSAETIALVSRDGEVIQGELPREAFPETFAIMCATVFAAAATAHLEMGRAAPVRIVVAARDATTVLVPSGPTRLLVVVAGPSADSARLARDAERAATRLLPR